MLSTGLILQSTTEGIRRMNCGYSLRVRAAAAPGAVAKIPEALEVAAANARKSSGRKARIRLH